MVHSTDMWSVVLVVAILVLLVHSVCQIIAITPNPSESPLPPPIALDEAMRCMGNGDILLCYPGRGGGGGSFLLRAWSELLCVMSQSISEHVSVMVWDGARSRLMVLENSNPMTRLMSIDEYTQVSHKKGLRVIWRPLRTGEIPHTVTDRIVNRVLGRSFPTPFQMLLQQLMAMFGMPGLVGNPTCIQLTLQVLRAGRVIPAHVNTLGWTTDSLSARCWPADAVLGPEFELILNDTEGEQQPQSGGEYGVEALG